MTLRENRRSGVLLHPTSFPGPYGIGELGEHARTTLDWIASAGFRLWQVLPLGPTSYGDSPYACLSAFAGNPMLISMDRLVEDDLLAKEDLVELKEFSNDIVDFGGVIPLKRQLLEKAFAVWSGNSDPASRKGFESFCAEKAIWLDDYALFMALKYKHEQRPWNEWSPEFRDRDPNALELIRSELADSIEREKWIQYIFFDQWCDIRLYAESLGIQVFGDMPIFVAFDSAEVWAERELFHLDDEGNPLVVAGVPPDYFSETGQRWGNPLYNWAEHKKQKFAWWISRIRAALDLVDMIRIDHFRGFHACWEIPAEEKTAINGQWVESPGYELFEQVRSELGELPLIAEDLGVITEDVDKLRESFGLPGMRVLQFAFSDDASNAFLPHNYSNNTIVYTGTHDNNTTEGWWEEEIDEATRETVYQYAGQPQKAPHEVLMRLAIGSVADTAIIPLQDILGLGSVAKMNKPSIESGNWTWRVRLDQLYPDHAEYLRDLNKIYGRLKEKKP